jgi:iron complex outermembrane receptor protein
MNNASTLPRARQRYTAAVLSLALVLPLGTAPVLAQQTDDESEAETEPSPAAPAVPPEAKESDNIEEVIVQSYRQVLRSSIDAKRESSTIVDSINTEDIGNLPALSLGEVLETITGASSTRSNAGVTEIAIRGLGPFLSATTFNGRQASNGSGDRSVNFSQFPSELVNSVSIYKSQQADMVEGGVAGVIDIGSVKPLDFGKRRIQLDLKGSYSPYADRQQNSDTLGYRGTFSYLDQFKTDDLGSIGLSFGLQRVDTSYPQERVFGSSSWNACDATITPVADSAGRWPRCSDTAIDLDGANRDNPFYLVPNSVGLRQQGEQDERNAVFTAVQWKLDPALEINFDFQYSKRDYSEDRHDLVLSDTRRVAPNPVFTDNGALRYFEGTSYVESQGDVLDRTEDYYGGGLNIAWNASERLRLSADVSYSGTERDTIERRSRLRSDTNDVYGDPLAFVADNPRFDGSVPYAWDFRQGDVPSIFIDPRFDVSNPAMFSDDALLTRDEEYRQNQIRAVKFDGAYRVGGWLQKIKGGLRYAETRYNDYDLTNTFTQDDRTVDAAVNEACRIAFPQSDFLSGSRGSVINSWATFDTLCQYRAYTGSDDIGLPAERRSPNSRDVVERTYAGYLMGEYATTISNRLLWGNFGVRVVRTGVASKGLRSALAVEPVGDTGMIRVVPTGDFSAFTERNYTTDVLPSFNAIFEITPAFVVRGAVYRALARPDPSSLGAGRDFELNSDSGGYNSVEEAIAGVAANGSPGLEPMRAWNGDLAFEWYPNKESIFSIALYYKSFQGGRVAVVRNESYEVGGDSVTVPVSQYETSKDTSDLSGIETTITHTFSYLPFPLNGLGVKMSYNYAESNYKTPDIFLGDQYDPETGGVTPGIIAPANISGFSRHVAAAQLFYEIGPLDLQAIYKYRSDSYQDFVGGNSQLRYVRSADQVDMRASYRVSRQLSLRFEALNLNNEPRRDDMPVLGSFRDYQIYGPSYYIGAQLRY